MNLSQHLRQYGIRHFEDDSYWDWGGELLHKRIGTKGMDKLDRLRMPLQSGAASSSDRQFFYDYISDARYAGVIHSLKAGAIEASGDKANRFVSNRKTILDFGCNIGYLTTWYAINNSLAKIIGFDINRKSTETAKLYASKFGLKNIQFHFGDINKLANQSFDLIIDTQSIFENENKIEILEWLSEHLTIDGTFLSIPQAGNLHEFVGYYELLNLAGLRVKNIEPLFFSDLGVYYGYGVFVCDKSDEVNIQINPQAVFEKILKSVKENNL